MRILDAEDVAALLTYEVALDAMRDLFRIAAEPDAVGIGRIDLHHPQGWLRALPGFIEPLGVFGFKTLNRTAGIGMRYAIYVHDLGTGALTGIVDGLAVTNVRTGAVSALATDLLAPPTVEVAALVGTGQVGRGQATAIQLVRPATTLRVYARTPQRRRAFIDEMRDVLISDLVEAPTLEEAVDGACLVTLATGSTEPVLHREHVVPGMHVNSVGPAAPDRHEIDAAAFAVFDRIVCDRADMVMREAGDAIAAVEGGFIDPADADDLSALVTGTAPPRMAGGETTLFKSVGNGLQDLMVAVHLLDAAERAGVGTTVDDFMSLKPFGPERR